MSNAKEDRPYGLWPSPLTPQSIAQGLRLSELAWDSDGQTLVWLEGRSGHGVLVCAPPGEDAPRDLTAELSVRARLGYGGGEFTVAHGQVYFVEQSGRLYRQPLAAGQAEPLTPGFGSAAAPQVAPDGQWLVFVHSYEGLDRLAVVDTAGRQWPQQIASGADFYMQPRWHPSGQLLAWVEWDQPNMPWDGTQLCLGRVEQRGELPQLGPIRRIAGGSEVAITQPEFSPDGRHMAYISDETGWGNLYLHDLQTGERRALTDEAAELGAPAWVQGLRTYGFRYDGQAIYFLRNESGFRSLWVYDLTRRQARPVAGLEEYSWFESCLTPAPGRDALALIGSSSTIPGRIISLEPLADGRARVRARSQVETVASADLSTARPISWPTAGGARAHGLYYPPSSSQYADRSGLPPAILRIHGGPTSQASASYQAEVQFFTTRGYAVLQVNYRGSTGYGREYMLALRGSWGVADVEDAVSAARYLGEAGLADPGRLVIMGGSAGGYTVLQTLVHHPGIFKAGICSYGVSSLFDMAAETHKFEAHYLDSIVGPLPETHERYRERSPIFYAERIRDPLALFQGDQDVVVPRDQSDSIVAVLRRRGVPHSYTVFEGEGHGWRKRETIQAYYTQIEQFLRKYVLFA